MKDKIRKFVRTNREIIVAAGLGSVTTAVLLSAHYGRKEDKLVADINQDLFHMFHARMGDWTKPDGGFTYPQVH